MGSRQKTDSERRTRALDGELASEKKKSRQNLSQALARERLQWFIYFENQGIFRGKRPDAALQSTRIDIYCKTNENYEPEAPNLLLNKPLNINPSWL